MNISKINHSNQEYGCGLGKAKLNLYNGKLGFEFPLISLGANNFKIGSSLIYNSQYKSIDFGGKKIGFGNGWKLNMHQYVFPYLSSYDIEGFEVGNYVYIDANWNIHKFVKYKSSSTYGDSRNSYYDADGTGLKLLVGSSATTQMFDQYNNTYLFDDDGRMIEVISGVNVGIIKKIIYSNGNLTSIYDQRKSSRKIQFIYNSNGTLKKAYTSVNNIGFNFEYNETKLVKVIKYCSSESKDIMDFIYNSVNRIEYAISSTDLTALKFNYTTFNGEGAVQKVCFGAMKKTILTEETDAELYVGEDVYLGEEDYVTGNGKRCIGFTLSMPTDYIKEEETISYRGSYTQVTNGKGISINNYFNTNGSTISSLEYKDGNLFTLSRAKGWILSTDGSSSLKLDGQAINILNSNNNFALTSNVESLESFKEIFKDLNEDNVRDEAFSEHFNVSFWMCFKNNSQSALKATLEYIVDDKKETSSVRYEQTNTGAWQQIVLPINLGLNQLSLSYIKLIFEGCASDTQIQIADLRIMKGGTPETYIYSGTGENYRELRLKIGTSFYYYSNGKINNETISPDFYMTENDIFLTYKSLFYSKKNKETYYDLVYNNGTKVKSVTYAGITDKDNDYDFSIDGNDIPNYYFKLVDIIQDGVWSIMEKQICFHYDTTKLKYYYETKTMMGTINNLDATTKRLSDESSYVTYNWQNADGTFRAKKDTRRIITENFYDSYGNTESIERFKEGNRDIETIKIDYTYSTTVESQRENIKSCSKNGITVEYNYENDDTIIETSEGDKVISYEYSSYEEDKNKITFIDTTSEISNITNEINYKNNSKIKCVKNNNDIYGFMYNIFNEIEEIYRNKELIIKRKSMKEGETKKEIQQIYQEEDKILLSTSKYDKFDRIISYENNNIITTFKYNNEENRSTLLEKIEEINDNFAGETYHFSYIDNEDIESENVIIDEKFEKNTFSNGHTNYSINKNEKFEYYQQNTNPLNESTISTAYKYKENNASNSILLEDFSFSYGYDDCGRLSEKNGTMTIYNQCQECEAAGGVSCEQVDGVKVDKKILYHNGTELPKKFTYKVTSKGMHTSDEIAEFYYENSKYDNQGNIINVVEGGTRFKENPKNVDFREKVTLPTRKYTYTYDAFNRIKNEINPQFGNLAYSYDSITGLIKEVKNNDVTTKEFVYDSGRLTKINNNGKIKKITYDYYGNMLNNHNATLSYNSRNLMDSYSKSEGEIDVVNVKCNYYYNYQGIRYKKKKVVDLNGRFPQYTYINYYLNGNTILGEDWTDGEGNVTKKLRYFYDAEGICGIRYDGYNFTLVKDSLGNVSKVMYKGKIIGEYLYDAWGNSIVNEISIANERDSFILHNNPFRYKGYYLDLESGLYYCNARYYDSTLCMWISPDNVEYLDPESINGLNLYCYCMCNPTMIIDKKGNQQKFIDWFNFSNCFDLTATLFQLIIGGAAIGGQHAVLTAVRPNNIGIGYWNKMRDAAIKTFESDILELEKLSKAFAIITVLVQVGEGVVTDINRGYSADRVISNAVVNGVVYGVTMWLTGALGAKLGGVIGSFIPIPVVGTVVGTAIGFVIGVAVGIVLELEINGKTIMDHVRDFVYDSWKWLFK